MTDLEPRAIDDLTLDECWDRLRAGVIGRLAVNNGHQPDVFPVNYVVDTDRIVIRTAEGTKLAAAIASGNVGFEIDDIDVTTRCGWSVVVHGIAHEPTTTASVTRDEALDLHPWAGASHEGRFIEIVPTRIRGRRLREQD